MSDKNKVGRPSKFESIDMQRVKILTKKGFTDVEMAEFFEVSKATWNNWKKVHEGFLDSIRQWKHDANRNVERALYEKAIGFEAIEDKVMIANGIIQVIPTIKYYPPDTTACIFFLKNREPEQWRDKIEHKHSGDASEPLVIQFSNGNKVELG